jgi:hypothetical protein
MRVALLFAGEQSVLALDNREARGPVALALVSLARQVERNDRTAVERGVTAARAAVEHYRELARNDTAVDPDLETMSLTLDQAAQLASRTQKSDADPLSAKSPRQESEP